MVNGAHQHLLVNHVSLFCLVIGFIALAVAMKRKSRELRGFASALFVVGGVFAWLAQETGEKAEKVIEALGGDVNSFLTAHEQAAEWALRSGVLVACLAIALEWSVRKKPSWAKALHWVVLLFALHGCTVFIATAMQGGMIRHTEVRP